MTIPTKEQVVQWAKESEIYCFPQGDIAGEFEALEAFSTFARADLEAKVALDNTIISDYAAKVGELEAENISLKETEVHYADCCESERGLRQQLAQAQAENDKLREALQKITKTPHMHQDHYTESVLDLAHAALATKSDNSTLREHDAKLVERIALGFVKEAYCHLMDIADKIRKGEWKP